MDAPATPPTFHSSWAPSPQTSQSRLIGAQSSSMSWPREPTPPSAPAFDFPQNWNRELGRHKVSAQRLRPAIGSSLHRWRWHLISKRQPSTLLWEFPPSFNHDSCHFYLGVWIGSRGGKVQRCIDGVAFLLSYVPGHGLKWLYYTCK